MAKKFKMVISPDGTILTSVYNSIFNIDTVGSPIINRATEVCFDNKDKVWEIIALKPCFTKEYILATGFFSRTKALEWEINYLHTNMLDIIKDMEKRDA